MPQKRHSTGLKYDPPYPTRFRLGRGGAVGGWGADVPRVLGEAAPRATAGGASGRFMGTKYPQIHTDDWDGDGRLSDMDVEGVDVQLLVNPGGPRTRAPDQHRVHARATSLSDDFCSHNPPA